MRIRLFPALCAAVLLLAGSALAADRVVVTAERANVMLGNRVVATVSRGDVLQKAKVLGDWIGVQFQRDGKTISGWIHKKDAVAVRISTAAPTETPVGPPPPKSREKPFDRRAWAPLRARAEKAVCLIRTLYRLVDLNVRDPRRAGLYTGGCWGTGFLVSRHGFVVTNKHVAEPWKLDLKAQAILLNHPAVRLDYQYDVWFAGRRFRVTREDVDTETAYSSARREVFLLCSPVDHYDYRTLREARMPGQGIVRCLNLSTDDLAVLWIHEDPDKLPPPIPLQTRGVGVQKLEKALLLGFPTAVQAIEGTRALPTALFANVRKIERTIQVDVSSNKGNSGGPLINRHGRVVGVLTRFVTLRDPSNFSCLKVGGLRSFAPELFAESDEACFRLLVAGGAYLPAYALLERAPLKNKPGLTAQFFRHLYRERAKFVNYATTFVAVAAATRNKTWQRAAFLRSLRPVSYHIDRPVFQKLISTSSTVEACQLVEAFRADTIARKKADPAKLISFKDAAELYVLYGLCESLKETQPEEAARARAELLLRCRRHADTLPATQVWSELLFAEGKWSEALPVLRRQLDAMPGGTATLPNGIRVEAMRRIGWCHYQLGDYRKAIDAYRKVLAKRSDDWTSLNNIAMAYLRLGEHKKAEEQAIAASMYGKGQVRSHAYYTLARIFCHGHHKDEAALRHLQRAVALGLRNIAEVRRSPFLRRIRDTSAFRRLLRFAYAFHYRDGRPANDVTLVNTSGFPWTNVRVCVKVDGAKWRIRRVARVDPGAAVKIPNVTTRNVQDIRQVFVLLLCDQGTWRVRHQPRNQTYTDTP